MTSALEGVLVVDLTSGVGGAYAGKLLADLGARVVLVEPPDGSPLRERGLLFAHLSGGKESATGGASLLRFILARADVLLTDGTSPYDGVVGADDALVEVDISPFGRTGPYAGWRGSDIATWAMGGYMYFTGEKTREPLWLPGSQAELHAGAHAAFATLAALHERTLSGLGQRIEVSELESALAAHAWLVSSWTATGQLLDRKTHDLIKCRDGWVYLFRPSRDLLVLMDRTDILQGRADSDDDEEQTPAAAMAGVRRFVELFREWAPDHDAAEIEERGQELRIPLTAVADAALVSRNVQMAERGWWESDPDERVRYPGQPYVLNGSPSRRRGRAPHAGEHTAAMRDEFTSPQQPRATSGRSVVAEPPLRGVRVVEITSNWAGPVCGRHLGDLGAEVVKIEWAQRPATRAMFWPGPGVADFQRQRENRAMYFNELNRNKRDLVLDLSVDAGREIFLDLMRTTDVLVENNSARVMPNLGLGYETLRAVNPRLIMCSMSGYGGTGPAKDWVAYGSNIETTSGLTSVTGYSDGQVYRTTLFYADPVGGIHGAVAVLAALEHRRRTGEGQWIDLSLNECGAGFCAEWLVEHEATGVVRGPQGNRDPRFAPQGAYRCAGRDDWVAICVQSDDDWAQVAAAIGRDDLAGLRTLEARRARHDELDEAIGAWTATREQYEVAWELQRRGVSAAPVLANWQILPDPHIAARGFYTPIRHPAVGVYPSTSWPWRFSRTPARVARPAPLFGEHTREVLTEIGVDEERIDKLYAEKVTADAPLW